MLDLDSGARVVGDAGLQRQLAAGIATGMAFLHAQPKPVLHHDLKSANILLFDAPGGGLLPKLADFGLAKVIGASTTGHSTMHASAGTSAASRQSTLVVVGPRGDRRA